MSPAAAALAAMSISAPTEVEIAAAISFGPWERGADGVNVSSTNRAGYTHTKLTRWVTQRRV